MKRNLYILTSMAAAVMMTANVAQAQELPKPSPAAKVEQRVGLTDLAIAYSRPGVKERVIFGELVKYDEMWRTGANASTLFATNDDIKVGGKELKAGEYAVLTVPGKTDWKVHFNTVTDGWGTGKYDAANDVLVISVKPASCEMTESMEMGFSDLKPTSANMYLRWEKTMISIPIEVDVDAKAWENIMAAIDEKPEDDRVLRNAANYCAESGQKLEEGLTWINKSIEIKEHWYSYWVKADVLAAMKNSKEAIKAANKAIELGEAAAEESGKPFKYKGELEEAIAKWKASK